MMLEKGDPLIVDGKPAEFVEYGEEIGEQFIVYKKRGEAGEFWMTMSSFAIRAKVVKKESP